VKRSTYGVDMSASPETLELLEWISSRRRTYDEAIEAWRSNCPHLAVWDDAFSDGLLQVVRDGREPHVALTSLGRAALAPQAPLT
jgi:hypothetical protein